jgi:hypothetical protein
MTAINEEEWVADKLVYPNPASDELYISLSFKYPVRAEVELLNELGIRVRYIPAVNRSVDYYQRLDLEGLSPGVYMVRIITDAGESTSRIIHL